jgi:hypothetical protein
VHPSPHKINLKIQARTGVYIVGIDEFACIDRAFIAPLPEMSCQLNRFPGMVSAGHTMVELLHLD